ncbi:PilW family protein [Desulfotomaculum copahuensis]|uniref:Prepilin-type N-terminal cleavage/methylation domain-containing protein n=1 Tax=Desulfotomaculum copahuensis TaxID=1838280 RepID=A0A1B7LBF0_9FIRM|nr:prepilin-type N-terminal cleavage/methylation domain-containing protein [Desulfotomaculum copahuensis]OAT79866.1 hypothetical protein A6M21_14800 [Desulfotomaculum copahuensis]
MKRIFTRRNQAGFTLVEVLLACALLVTIISAAFNIFRTTEVNGNNQTDETLAIQQATVALDRITKSIQGANSLIVIDNHTLQAMFAGQDPVLISYAGGTVTKQQKQETEILADGLKGFQFYAQVDSNPGAMQTVKNVAGFQVTTAVNGKDATLYRSVKAQTSETVHPDISLSTATQVEKQLNGPVYVTAQGLNFAGAPDGKPNQSNGGRPQVWIKNPDGSITDISGLVEISGSNTLQISEKDNPLASASPGDYAIIVQQGELDTAASYKITASGGGGGGGGGGSGWTIPACTRYSEWTPDWWTMFWRGWMLLGRYLFHFPWSNNLYTVIYKTQSHENNLDFTAHLTLYDFWWPAGGPNASTAGIAFYAPPAGTQNNFLYFGIQEAGGKAYAVFRDFRAGSQAGFTQLALLGDFHSGNTYVLRVSSNGSNFTFYVNDSQVGTREISDLPASGYAGVWKDWENVMAVYTFSGEH